MKEYIEKAAALDICQKEYEERLRMADYCGDTVAWNIGGAIKNTPAADVVEVVRCRDCKWFNHYTMECESDDVATDHEGGASFSINFGPDDFCSYGQRKEAAHEVSE